MSAVEYIKFQPGQATMPATQVFLNGEPIALYWHRDDGFRRGTGTKLWPTEHAVRKEILRAAIDKRLREIIQLRASLKEIQFLP